MCPRQPHIRTSLPAALSAEPFFGQAEEEGKLVPTSAKALGSARHRGACLVFLGVQEQLVGDGCQRQSIAVVIIVARCQKTRRCPRTGRCDAQREAFFCVDVAEGDQAGVDIMFSQAAEKGQDLSWMDARAVMAGLGAVAAGAYAQGRSMVDCNQRNKVNRSHSLFSSDSQPRQFCPACGVPTYSMWGGWKISCATLLHLLDRTGRNYVQRSSFILLSILCDYSPLSSCRWGLHNFFDTSTNRLSCNYCCC